MAPISPEDQVKFLLSCIKFSDNGKVNFTNVANDCGIISAGAAAKRYSRLVKSKGDTTTGGDQEEQSAVSPPKPPNTPKRKATVTPKGSGKKSKVTKEDAVMAAESFVEACLEPTKEEFDAALFPPGIDTDSE